MFTVVAAANFPADDRPVAAFGAPPADAPTILLAAQGPGGQNLGQDDVKFSGALAKLGLVSVAYAGANQITLTKDVAQPVNPAANILLAAES